MLLLFCYSFSHNISGFFTFEVKGIFFVLIASSLHKNISNEIIRSCMGYNVGASREKKMKQSKEEH